MEYRVEVVLLKSVNIVVSSSCPLESVEPRHVIGFCTCTMRMILRQHGDVSSSHAYIYPFPFFRRLIDTD
jgi:hypothetical protein